MEAGTQLIPRSRSPTLVDQRARRRPLAPLAPWFGRQSLMDGRRSVGRSVSLAVSPLVDSSGVDDELPVQGKHDALVRVSVCAPAGESQAQAGCQRQEQEQERRQTTTHVQTDANARWLH